MVVKIWLASRLFATSLSSIFINNARFENAM